MAKNKPFQFLIVIDVRSIIRVLGSPTVYALLGIASIAFFKDKTAQRISEQSLIASQRQVCFVQTSQPFAGMTFGFNFHYVQPIVGRVQGNASLADTGGEVMGKHGHEIFQFVTANTHLKHVTRRSNVLSISSQKNRIVTVAKKGATDVGLFMAEGVQSLSNKKWNGLTFNYSYDFTSKQPNQPVKATETEAYAFTTRDKIQRGDGTVNAFLPTKQLGRNTTLEFESGKIEHALSTAVSGMDFEFEDNLSTEETLSTPTLRRTYSESELQGGPVMSGIDLEENPPTEETLSTEETLPSLRRTQSEPELQGDRLAESDITGFSQAVSRSESATVNVVQTGYTDESPLDLQAEGEMKENAVYGLADMVVSERNTQLFNGLQKSPRFEAVAKLAYQEVKEDLNQRIVLDGEVGTSDNTERVFQEFPGLFQDPQNNQVSVYTKEPYVLNKLLKFDKLLELANSMSVPGYQVHVTGEKIRGKSGEDVYVFSTFGNVVVYNRKNFFRDKVREKVRELSTESITYSKAVTVEELVATIPEEDRLEALTRIVVTIRKIPESAEQVLSVYLGDNKIPLEPITYDTSLEADHFIRKNGWVALGQRLLNTAAGDDKSLCVELPPMLHDLKEVFTNFRESKTSTYQDGLIEYLKGVSASIHEGLANTTPEERRYVSVETYQRAYQHCFEAKVAEMQERFPNFTEREKLMIYHAQVARVADQQDFESFHENCIGNSNLKESAVNVEFQKNTKLAADLLIRNASQRGGFIITLSEFCSSDCAQYLLSIEKQHKLSVLSQIEEMYRHQIIDELSEQDREALYNPLSLTKIILEDSFNAESGKVESLTEEVIDRKLYDNAVTMGLTNIGAGLPSPGPLLSYQVQDTRIINERDLKAEKDLTENNTLLIELLNDKALIRDSRKLPFEFASQNAQELHAFLIENDIPKSLADKLVIDKGIETVEALAVALNDGIIREIPGVGEGKEAKVKAVINMHSQSAANVSATTTTDNASEPSNTVANPSPRKPSVRGVKASRSTSDLVSLQKSKSTLSKVYSDPGGSNLLESSNEVKLLGEGPSSQ